MIIESVYIISKIMGMIIGKNIFVLNYYAKMNSCNLSIFYLKKM